MYSAEYFALPLEQRHGQGGRARRKSTNIVLLFAYASHAPESDVRCKRFYHSLSILCSTTPVLEVIKLVGREISHAE